jgi:hypothetical protein
MDGTCSTYETDKKYIQYFGWKTLRERPIRRPRCRWEYNIRMYVREIWLEPVGLMHAAQDRDQWRAPVNTVMNLRIP